MLQEVERQRWEEHRKSQQEAAQTKAELARYEDELARQRSAAEHEKAKQRNAEMVSLQNENLRRQNEEKLRLQAQIEAERRATEQYRVSRWCCFRREFIVTAGSCGSLKSPAEAERHSKAGELWAFAQGHSSRLAGEESQSGVWRTTRTGTQRAQVKAEQQATE